MKSSYVVLRRVCIQQVFLDTLMNFMIAFWIYTVRESWNGLSYVFILGQRAIFYGDFIIWSSLLNDFGSWNFIKAICHLRSFCWLQNCGSKHVAQKWIMFFASTTAFFKSMCIDYPTWKRFLDNVNELIILYNKNEQFLNPDNKKVWSS